MEEKKLDQMLSRHSNEAKKLYDQINYALENNKNEEAFILGKQVVDKYINNEWSPEWDTMRVLDRISQWKSNDLKEYAISKFSEKNTRDSLEYAVQLSEELGKKDEAKKYLERVYQLTLKAPPKFHYAAADYAVRLERFDDAIDLYMNAGWFENALSTAKSYSEGRIKEVAQKGFEHTSPKKDPKVYLECAEILGLEKIAKIALQNEARYTAVKKAPVSYIDLVTSLKNIGLKGEAENLTERIRSYELHERKDKNVHHLKQLANIYSVLDNSEEEAHIKELIMERQRAYSSN
ncbi:MAG TPA: hypothetical protein VEC16_05680 [Alphaproteobacteria bacterium]|nr:hypothetical protein [Alphaproteobacteria bacterium]